MATLHLSLRTRYRISKFLLVYALPLLLYSTYLFVNLPAFQASCEKGADHELIGLSVEGAKHFETCTGPYSRFHFRHPGPILFYYYALAERVIPAVTSPMGKHLIAQLSLNAFFLIVALALLFERIRPRSATPLAAALSLFCFASAAPTFLHDYWNPNVLMMATLCLLVSAAATACGSKWALLSLSISATVMLHSHLGAVVPLLAIVPLSVALAWKNSALSTKEWLHEHALLFMAAFGIAIIPSIPPLLETVRDPTLGNLGAILDFRRRYHSHMGFTKAVRFFVDFYFSVIAWPHKTVSVLLFAFSMIVPWLHPHPNKFFRILRLFTIILSVAAFVGATQIIGKPAEYIIRYHRATVALQFLLCVITLMYFIRRYCRTENYRLLFRAAPLLISAIIVAKIFPLPFAPNTKQCGRRYSRFIHALKPVVSQPLRLVVGDKEAWPFVAGLALHLSRTGADVCFDRAWGTTFEPGLVCERKLKPGEKAVPVTIYREAPEQLPKHHKVVRGKLNTLIY